MGRERDADRRGKYELTAQEKPMGQESMSEASENGKLASLIVTTDQKANRKIQYLLVSNFRWKNV